MKTLIDWLIGKGAVRARLLEKGWIPPELGPRAKAKNGKPSGPTPQGGGGPGSGETPK